MEPAGTTVAVVNFWSLPLLTSGVCDDVEISARLFSVPVAVGFTVSVAVAAWPGARLPISQRMLVGAVWRQPFDRPTNVVFAGTEVFSTTSFAATVPMSRTTIV